MPPVTHLPAAPHPQTPDDSTCANCGGELVTGMRTVRRLDGSIVHGNRCPKKQPR